MTQITLGSTGITAPQNGFGALPIQRDSTDVAVQLLRKAYENGVSFFDTARAYTDSEKKIGIAFGDMGVRDKIFIASKTMSTTPEGFWSDLEASLRELRTEYIDIYQFHTPNKVFRPGDGTGMYECMLEAKAQGKIRHIGYTNHSIYLANECVDSRLYETLQFPFSYLTGEEELKLVAKCKKANMGYIAMKALAGGLITNSAAAYAYISQYDNVMPIWGVQHEHELDEFLSYMKNPPELTDGLKAQIATDREELQGGFCRSCGYCMPCPMDINIRQCARMSLLIRRAPHEQYLLPEWQEEMAKTEKCIACGQCTKRCPYSLDIPSLLKVNYEDYKLILSSERKVSND